MGKTATDGMRDRAGIAGTDEVKDGMRGTEILAGIFGW